MVMNYYFVSRQKNRASPIDCFYALHNDVLLRINHELLNEVVQSRTNSLASSNTPTLSYDEE